MVLGQWSPKIGHFGNMFGDVNLKGYQAGLHGTVSESRNHRVINVPFVLGLDKDWLLAE